MIIKFNFWVGWCLCVVMLFLMLGCQTIAPIPNTDIIFQAANPHTFGFINSDGTNLEYIDEPSRQIRRGAPVVPIETFDGKYLVFHESLGQDLRGSAGYMSAFTEGKIKKYEILNESGIAPTLGHDQIIIQTVTHPRWPENPQSSLQLFDMKTESIIETYYTTDPGVDISLGTNVIYSSTLFFARYSYSYPRSPYPTTELVSLDMKTKEEKVILIEDSVPDKLGRSLFYPAISPNGKWIAYSTVSGLYVIDVEGKGKKRIANICENCESLIKEHAFVIPWPSAPAWSPDSQWVIYHRCMLPSQNLCTKAQNHSIYKLNIETGDETLLVKEGVNPYWRLSSRQ